MLRWPYAENDRAQAERLTDGLIKVLVTPRGHILGAGIVGVCSALHLQRQGFKVTLIDRLAPGERCASTSNRNFEGRQGQGGRTHLVSPAMAAAAAVTGHFVDVRTLAGG